MKTLRSDSKPRFIFDTKVVVITASLFIFVAIVFGIAGIWWPIFKPSSFGTTGEWVASIGSYGAVLSIYAQIRTEQHLRREEKAEFVRRKQDQIRIILRKAIHSLGHEQIRHKHNRHKQSSLWNHDNIATTLGDLSISLASSELFRFSNSYKSFYSSDSWPYQIISALDKLTDSDIIRRNGITYSAFKPFSFDYEHLNPSTLIPQLKTHLEKQWDEVELCETFEEDILLWDEDLQNFKEKIIQTPSLQIEKTGKRDPFRSTNHCYEHINFIINAITRSNIDFDLQRLKNISQKNTQTNTRDLRKIHEQEVIKFYQTAWSKP